MGILFGTLLATLSADCSVGRHTILVYLVLGGWDTQHFLHDATTPLDFGCRVLVSRNHVGMGLPLKIEDEHSLIFAMPLKFTKQLKDVHQSSQLIFNLTLLVARIWRLSMIWSFIATLAVKTAGYSSADLHMRQSSSLANPLRQCREGDAQRKNQIARFNANSADIQICLG